MYNMIQSELLLSKYTNVLPSDITKTIALQFNITTDVLVDTPPVSFFMEMGKSAYHHIITAYTKAKLQTDDNYIAMMVGDKLNVIKMGEEIENLLLTSNMNLTEASYDENADNVVNSVIVVDEKGAIIDTIQTDLMEKLGLMQKIYKEEENINYNSAVKSVLDDIENSASVDAIGHIKAIAGFGIAIKDNRTNLKGLFYINSDTHTWQNGEHTMSLSLAFSNLMDEQSGDEEKDEQ